MLFDTDSIDNDILKILKGLKYTDNKFKEIHINPQKNCESNQFCKKSSIKKLKYIIITLRIMTNHKSICTVTHIISSFNLLFSPKSIYTKSLFVVFNGTKVVTINIITQQKKKKVRRASRLENKSMFPNVI